MRGFRVVDASRRLLMSTSQYSKLFCTGNNKNGSNKVNGVVPPARDLDVYQQLEKLDFMTAAKILFTTPPKKKKFGIDFHLVQLFFACMPSLAVYLVAQYARYEIRRMEAEEELKKKQAEEEEKAKEIEASTSEEIPELGRDRELLNVKVRLDALEETVKQIAFETKKVSAGNKSAAQDSNKREKPVSLNSVSKSCASTDKNLTPQAEKSNVSNETVSRSAPSPETAKSEQGRVE